MIAFDGGKHRIGRNDKGEVRIGLAHRVAVANIAGAPHYPWATALVAEKLTSAVFQGARKV